jgi:hypothetical protein
MDVESTVELSETLSNLIENVACHVSQDRGGRLTPAQLVPYLPMSLRMIEAGLDGMVNDQSVFAERSDGIKRYVFAAYQDRPARQGPSEFDACASCGTELGEWMPNLLCAGCTKKIHDELKKLAEQNAWPAHAVYEHEILYCAARQTGGVPAEMIAADSPYTLRATKAKLKRLVVEGFVAQQIDEKACLERFVFPLERYPKERFAANMEVIRSYPASVIEETELRIVRVIVALALMVLGMFVLALMRVPFPYLVGSFVVAAPIVSLAILRRHDAPAGES